MRKRWKIFWIVCAALAAAGLLLFGAGAALGGFEILRTAEDDNILESWLDRLGIGVTRSVKFTRGQDAGKTGDSGYDAGEYQTAEPDGELVTSYDGIRELSLDLAVVHVRILPWGGEEIIVDLSGVRADLAEKTRIEAESGALEIKMEGNVRWNTNDAGILYVSVPESLVFEKVSADAGTGMIEMEGIAARELKADAGVGSVRSTGFSVETLEAECGVGEIVLDGTVASGAELDCDLGAIDLTLSGERADYDYDVNCGMGEVTVDGRDIGGFGTEVREDNGTGRRITTDCGMGSVTIGFRQP